MCIVSKYNKKRNKKMIPKKERQLRISQMLHKNGYVTSSELSKIFHVSDVTIRKDLDELARSEYIERTFGGATVRQQKSTPIPPTVDILNAYQNMSPTQYAMYAALASKALEFVDRGDTIFLGSGNTCCVFADLLPEDYHLSVVTNNLSALSSLIKKNINIFLVGGEVATTNRDTYFSSIADPGHYLEAICVSKAFTSCYGIGINTGITVESVISSYIFKSLPNIQRAWYVMASPEKFSQVGMYKICSIDAVEKIIYKTIPSDFFDYCHSHNIALAQAEDPIENLHGSLV